MAERKYICTIDRMTSIVIRNRRAAHLGLIQFAIFRALHEARTKNGRTRTLNSRALYERLYNGCKEPPGLNTLNAIVHYTNLKLKHLGLKIKGSNHGKQSTYEIVMTEPCK